ncbi:hypothetical protein ACQP00_19505 [Dactylosporangium sp. CS-047395]|uniref:hypothetical protein n=1 Tax=Dactylosporangium sp. CS-047395 TaxID=3239936 RepID=UPI003D92A26A
MSRGAAITTTAGPNDHATAPAIALDTVLTTLARTNDGNDVQPEHILTALTLLRTLQQQLEHIEPELVAAARRAGVSWQGLATAMGVASRQAAERRYLRTASGNPTDGTAATREGRVRAERDHRAGTRAVARWANDHTADLRRIAGQVAALTDLPATAASDLDALHVALGAADAVTLPARLAALRQYLIDRHPHLADQIGQITTATNDVRHATQQQRDQRHPDPDPASRAG